jgi:hypothetical protein
MSSLFEVEIQNRVISGSSGKRIMGTQGNWYQEKLYFLADLETEAKKFAIEKLEKRPIIGILKFTRRNIRREIKILEIRRIA